MERLEEFKNMAQRMLAMLGSSEEQLIPPTTQYPSWFFTDPALFEREKKHLFGKQPLIVGLSSDVPNSGDFFTRDDLEIPTIITRDNDGKVNALLNICTHRAARLKEGFGNARSLSCPYHAWNFGLDGTLKKVFKQDSFGDIDKCDYNLDKIPCEEKYGLIFLSFDDDSDLDIEKYLGDLSPMLDMWDFSKLNFVGEHEWIIEKNWKLSLDKLCDRYHLDSAQEGHDRDRLLDTAVEYNQLGPSGQHHIMTFPNVEMLKLKNTDENAWDENVFDTFQVSHFIFPNVGLLMSQSSLEFLAIYPGELPDEHLLRYRSYARSDTRELSADEIHDASFDKMRKLLDRKVALKTGSAEHQSKVFEDGTSHRKSDHALNNILMGISKTLEFDLGE